MVWREDKWTAVKLGIALGGLLVLGALGIAGMMLGCSMPTEGTAACSSSSSSSSDATSSSTPATSSTSTSSPAETSTSSSSSSSDATSSTSTSSLAETSTNDSSSSSDATSSTSTSDECTPYDTCDGDERSSDCCSGVCRTYAGAGEVGQACATTCNDDDDCPSSETAAAECVAGRCALLCSSSADCAAGAICVVSYCAFP